MKRKNATRNALFTSVISLLLCVSMLVGTTFAWFTDSVVSGINTIAAGNLDVELYHSDKNDSGYVTADTKLFNDITLWEPGVVVYENFKVENVGNLALKYQLSINFENETKVTDAEGIEHGLSEVLKVGVVKGGFTGGRAEAQNVNFDESLSTFTREGYLEGDTISETYGIVIYWAPNANEVDNLFNMNNSNKGKTLSIDLGINLVATQEMYESDSFGDDYDEGLTLPDVDGDVLVEKDGIQYYYDEEGNYILYLVTEAYIADTVNVPEGVDAIGNYAFAYNANVKTVNLSSTVRSLGRGFDSSAVEKVVLNEGLEKIDSRAFRSTANLQEVVIPSTVKVIEDNAFQKSGIKDITIPATVETIGEAAFGASKIDSVTFEGNTSIQGYAFRGCPNLRTVTMKGDDVTFIASTLNGRNSMWFCNGESNNAGTSDIDFYVMNSTVASRVKTAMGAEANNTDVYIMGGEAQTTFVTVKNASELQTALDAATGNTVISFTADIKDDVTATEKNGVKIVVDGNNHKFGGVFVVDGKSSRNENNALTIQNINFEAETLSADAFIRLGTGANTNDRYTDNVTVKDCTFTGEGFVAVKSYTGGDHNVVIEGCTVNAGMHSLAQLTNVEKGLKIIDCKVYSKNGANLNNTLALEMSGCTFEVQGYAVRFGTSGTVNTDAKSFQISGSTLKSACAEADDAVIVFRDSSTKATLNLSDTTLDGTRKFLGNTDNTSILYNGITYVTTSGELASAVAAGKTELYLADGEYDVANCGGKTLTISGSKNAVLKVMNEGEHGCDYGFDSSTVTFNGVTFDTSANGSSYPGYARMNATYNNCAFVGQYSLFGNSEFNDCVFTVSGDMYNLWTWGAPVVTMNKCTFNSDGKAILLYGNANTKLTLNTCVFNDNGALTALKAAVEIGNDYNATYELIVNNTTVNGYEINDKGINTGSTLWGNKDSMGTDKLNVVIDGVDVY